MNCRFRVKFYDAEHKDIFFSTIDELHDIVDSEM